MGDKLEKAKDAADNLGRIATVWGYVPEPVKGVVWSAIPTAGMVIFGRMGNLTGLYLYGASICTTALGALVYMRIQENRRSRAPLVEIVSAEVVGSSTSVLRSQAEATQLEATRARLILEAAKEPPKIRVHVVSGKSVVVVVENEGRAFSLQLSTQITEASLPIDDPSPRDYIPRKFSSGAKEQTYEIATINDDGSVNVQCEMNYVFQRFSTLNRPGSAR
jgi:hypothetical protein